MKKQLRTFISLEWITQKTQVGSVLKIFRQELQKISHKKLEVPHLRKLYIKNIFLSSVLFNILQLLSETFFSISKAVSEIQGLDQTLETLCIHFLTKETK